MSRIKTFKSKIKIKHYALCGIALALFYLNACSSDNKPIKNILTVEDPIEIELNGIDDKEIATNVESYLATLPHMVITIQLSKLIIPRKMSLRQKL